MNGLSLLNPWGLAALGGLAVVGVIYLFYERYREQKITGLFLWDAPEGFHEGGRRLARPRSSRSLILDLLAVLLLALAVAAPAWVTRSGVSLVVIVDGSLSMQANGNDARAVQEAQELISRFASEAGVLVIEAGSSPRVLAGPGADGPSARQALSEWEPHDPSESLRSSITLSRELVTGRADLHVITDHDPQLGAPSSASLTIHALSAQAPNVAVLDAVRHRPRTGGKETLVLVLGGFGARDLPATLTVEGEKADVFEKMLTLTPDTVEQVTLTLPRDEGRVEVRLESEHDALESDSVAVLLPEPDRTVTWSLDVVDGADRDAIDRALVASGAVNAGAEVADLAIHDGTGATGNVLTVELTPLAGDDASMLGPFVVDMAHPLCRDLDLTGVYWTLDADGAQEGVNGPLVSVGSRPLMWFASPHSLRLDLSPSRSNIVRSAAWPVLVSNLVIWSAENIPGLHRRSYRPGEVPEYVPYRDPGLDPEAITGGGVKIDWRPGAPIPRLPSRPGSYTLERPGAEDESIVVNAIAPAESDLRALAPESRQWSEGNTGLSGGGTRVTSLIWILLSLALAVFVTNWLLDRGRKR